VLGHDLGEAREDGGLEVRDFRNGFDDKVDIGEVLQPSAGGETSEDGGRGVAG
jgi:hypothetical protein